MSNELKVVEQNALTQLFITSSLHYVYVNQKDAGSDKKDEIIIERSKIPELIALLQSFAH